MPPTKAPKILQTFVMIPRASFTEEFWGLPWTALLARAERGDGGTSVFITDASMQRAEERIRYDARKDGDEFSNWVTLVDVALMRQGDKPYSSTAVLHAQAW